MSEPRVIADPRHPCAGQRGLFATRRWAARRAIGRYEGAVRDYRRVADTSYCVGISADGWRGYCVDGADGGSDMRYVNDYRGVAASPNVRYLTVGGPTPVVVVVTTRPVPAGREFVADYGYEC